ncbi:MAG: sulfite exporter TauE/SafE family protein [Alphaproteobacteria bacterium]|uniref:sulfite exporter TauE/SafE family protein n=1 Tax=Maricaulis alexandrii TaxID=2570354 RepID=UPI0011090413|nr:sulfite exporter TauE/SafE family protein [Maricaulis alexandrii]MCR9267690.1 sulfite exporter TauE/SafE family protein [Alphaproteobacteria bacterium]
MPGQEFELMQLGQLVGVLMLAGLVAGFAAGLFGIGGGFVVVPALLLVFSFFGVEPMVISHVAIGTSLATIIVTSLRSVHAHNKRGAVDFQVIRDWAPWLVLGVSGGLLVARELDGQALKWVFAIGVLIMGVHFIYPLIRTDRMKPRQMPRGPILAGIATFLGAFSALLGIGGGTIAVLVMTACGRPIHQAIATAAGFGFIIALPGTAGFILLGLGQADLPLGSFGYINLIAVVCVTAMSFITAPLGVRAAHRLNAKALEKVFGVYLVATSALVIHNSLGL